MKRFGWTSVLALGLAASLTACKKEAPKEEAEVATTDEVPVAPAEPGAAAALPTEGADPAVMAEPSAEEKEFAENSVAVMEKMAVAAEASGGDCDKAADAMMVVVNENQEFITKAKTFEQNPANKAWFDANYGAKAEGVMQKLMPILQKCQDNEKLTAVFAAFQ